MPIKIQKILVFIPGVNFITILSWFLLTVKIPVRFADHIKECFKMLGIIMLATLIRIVFFMFISNEIIRGVFFLVWAYCVFSAIAWYAVRIQEKMIERSKQA